jgi:hypothetical protein
MDQNIRQVTEAFKAAQEGITYHTKGGARCPYCGSKLRVRDTLPWVGDSRIRYHLCPNPDCPIRQAEMSVRSIQTL